MTLRKVDLSTETCGVFFVEVPFCSMMLSAYFLTLSDRRLHGMVFQVDIFLYRLLSKARQPSLHRNLTHS